MRVARFLFAIAVLFAGIRVEAATTEADLRFAAGTERSTAIDAARDLSVLVAPDARVSLDVLATAGSVENVRRLRSDPNVRLGLVQADVFKAYVDLAAGGDVEAAEMIRPLRVVLPLFTEEIHFIVRADSPLKFVDEIRDSRINLGERGSGSALTTASLYRLMFDAAIPDARANYFTSEEALVKLVNDGGVDVVVVVGGQPLRLIEDMRPEARQHVKLLRFSEGHPSRDKVLQTYGLTTLRERSYPNLLTRDIEALSVRTLLVTQEDVPPFQREAITRFAGALCRNLDRLQRHGHPKWREVDVRLPDLGPGWTYDAATSRALSACIADRVSDRRVR
ncbi:MAG TPA: TAXI family TRAP transporter solute-binding subunit [Casimicrobiaceae bacterium]|nr:TAXI family TRAP transporter solute-binding subunit [Casimicrobiaceae bacterium]